MSNIDEFSNFQPDLLCDKSLKKELNSMATGTDIEKKFLDAPKSDKPKLQHPLQTKSMFRPTIANTIQMYKKVGGTAQSEKFIKDLTAASKLNRGPPGFSNSSRVHFDIILGRDEKIGYGDYINYDYDGYF